MTRQHKRWMRVGMTPDDERLRRVWNAIWLFTILVVAQFCLWLWVAAQVRQNEEQILKSREANFRGRAVLCWSQDDHGIVDFPDICGDPDVIKYFPRR